MSPEGTGSVTGYLDELKCGNQDAARALWDRYFTQLVRRAHAKLRAGKGLRLSADGEDVALSVLASFFEGLKNGHFPDLHDREELRRLLFKLTANKAIDRVRRAGRIKRGAGQVADEDGLELVAGPDLDPVAIASADEEYDRLLDLLGEDRLREIALLRTAGHTVDEIAAFLELSPRTIKYDLQTIREIWEREVS